MNFDDHEIWGAPVRTPEPALSAAPTAPAPVPAPAGAGRLYRSAGSEPHPEAILALPKQRRISHRPIVDPVVESAFESPLAASPVVIDSRLPRTPEIADAAIAEVLAPPTTPAPPRLPSAAHSGFTTWFRQTGPVGEDGQDLDADFGQYEDIPRGFSAALLGLTLLVVVAVAGTLEAVIRDSIGIPTGIVLVLASIATAFTVRPDARWAAWVLPAYCLIGATLVAGQFLSSAPGGSVIGQALLVLTMLVKLAPWLALATASGMLVPALRARR